MPHKIYDDAVVKGSVTAEAPASTGAYRVLVHNNSTKKMESVDPSEIGGGGTPSGCYNVCGIIQGRNRSALPFRYRVGNAESPLKPENVVAANTNEPQYPFFAGEQDYYADMQATLIIKDDPEGPPPVISGLYEAIAFVVAQDGYILFAKTLSPDEIQAYIDATPTGPWEMPWQNVDGSWFYGEGWGYITLSQFMVNADTNTTNMGVLAVGWKKPFTNPTTVFDTAVEMIGGGKSAGPLTLQNDPEYPSVPWGIISDGFSTKQWGSEATSGQLVITGTNNEAEPLEVVMVASFDSSLNFSEVVPAGGTYSKTVPMTIQQLLDNDFYVNFQPPIIS